MLTPRSSTSSAGWSRGRAAGQAGGAGRGRDGYVGDLYEVHHGAGGGPTPTPTPTASPPPPPGGTHTTSYYVLPGATVVRVDGVVSYVLSDHLGSANVVLNYHGDVVRVDMPGSSGEWPAGSGQSRW